MEGMDCACLLLLFVRPLSFRLPSDVGKPVLSHASQRPLKLCEASHRISTTASLAQINTAYNISHSLLPSKQPARESNGQHHPNDHHESRRAPHTPLRPKDLFLLTASAPTHSDKTTARLTSLQSFLLSSGFPLVHSFGPPNPLTTDSSSTSRSVKSNPPTNVACFPAPTIGSGDQSFRAPRIQRKGQRTPQRKYRSARVQGTDRYPGGGSREGVGKGKKERGVERGGKV